MKKCICLLTLSCLATSGCVSDSYFYRGYSSPDIDENITFTSDKIMRALLNPAADDKKKNPDNQNKINERQAIVSEDCVTATSTTDRSGKCRTQRNNAIYTLMTGSEQVCLIHRRSIYGRDASFNVTAGTLTSLFAGISTVATPAVSKSIFSALAMFSNSERSLVNEVVYKQMIITAVDNKIQQTRETKAIAIAQHLKDDDITAYPLSKGINDFMDYHNSCSFMEGLRLALANGTQNPTENKINTLNNRVLLNNAQMNLYCRGKQESDKQMCSTLTERNKAIADELKTLEVQ
ncbi:hypothetical protein QQF54_09815 [Lelliottia sp. V106_10]|uniref:hypothetical protein n=1 Tax=Lelliottia TaxID=1330545 RepID=UPI00254B4C4A|nr:MULTISPECIES: hypothetical protein [unclassified Lelliottia]MDK9358952.1 hypothetical protein [Lelliottia sp. V106_16]MDK9373640.1 hypothetical protein [Lelliottia sp. V106_10]MDK9600320.1 hypothetical protein [Lelliottia sp. V106_5]